ncbi:MAG: hypothetical protein JW874_02160 [Spirochaetales bacterium]|nr:hypothetical protein [Spirochaetales bacterium]
MLLCCFFLFVIIYHAFLLCRLNGQQQVTAAVSGEQKTNVILDVRETEMGPDAEVSEEKEVKAEDAPVLSEELQTACLFRDRNYPGLNAEIVAAAGFHVPVEVDWESLAAKGWAHIYESAFPRVYFLPLVRALKKYNAETSDQNKLQRVLNKIRIKNSGKYFSSTGISLDKGVLVIDHQPQANIDIGASEREECILQLLINASGR